MTSAAPSALAPDQAHGQSLATGAAGSALLPIERALAGRALWSSARSQIQEATAGQIDAGQHVGLYYGAPAILFVLHAAGADGCARYQHELAVLDRHVTRVTRSRLTAAGLRISHGAPTHFREYDLFHGLTGLGALLLRRHPHDSVLGDVLSFLVRLTQPRRIGGTELPGWWVQHDPDPTLPTPGGHANLGMAHGAAGILAMLSLAARHALAVDGQHEAIQRLAGWFDTWRQHSEHGPWWPQWITRDDLRTGRPTQPGPGRASWCYGSIGISRALQLAALATGDTARAHTSEQLLLATLTERNLAQLTEPGLCHGMAGLYQTVFRAAHDSSHPQLGQQLPLLATALTDRLATSDRRPRVARGEGILTGKAGTELTLDTVRHSAPHSGWDRCLLIS